MLVVALALAEAPGTEDRIAAIELAHQRVGELTLDAHRDEDAARSTCLEPKLEALGALVGAAHQVEGRLSAAEATGHDEAARLEVEKLRIAEQKALELANDALACLVVLEDGEADLTVDEPDLADVEAGDVSVLDEMPVGSPHR